VQDLSSSEGVAEDLRVIR